ncbi:hypothetical protein B0O80DRAFT_503441 [Mortierella sp. GBAus27b]|nr:hypothetical protein BGX31_007314 [Mortierella sp. GBA43]KAI8346535.1 hypothetical protein B0O80DRAFT_503441 [Mortierella sp. GBAus27b]
MPLSPKCVVSDGSSLYAVAVGYEFERGSWQLPDLFVARSDQYPVSINDLNWKVIDSLRWGSGLYFDRWERFSCTWDPRSNSVAVMARDSRNKSLFTVEMGVFSRPIRMGGVASERVTSGRDVFTAPTRDQSSFVVQYYRPGNQLKFFYPGDKVPDKGWVMNETTSGRDMILSYADNTLYALGLRNTTPPSYAMSIIPLNTSTIPPPMPSTFGIVDLSIDPSCQLFDSDTMMQTDKQTIDILCSLRPSDGKSQGFRLFKFDRVAGTTTQHSGPPMQEDGDSFAWVPVPKLNDSASWAYAYTLSTQNTYEFSLIGGDSWVKPKKGFGVDKSYIGSDEYRGLFDDQRHDVGPLMGIIAGALILMGIVLCMLRRRSRAIGRRNTLGSKEEEEDTIRSKEEIVLNPIAPGKGSTTSRDSNDAPRSTDV